METTVTKIDLDELERKAKAAGADAAPWFRSDQYTLCCRVVDAGHIAASSPPVVLALIARIRELETAMDGALEDVAMQASDARNGRYCGDKQYQVDRARRDAWLALLEKGAVLP